MKLDEKIEKNLDKSPEDKRVILQDIGKIVLNQGEMAFQLEPPYQLAEKTVKVYEEALKFSEPSSAGLRIDVLALPDHILSKWRHKLFDLFYVRVSVETQFSLNKGKVPLKQH